MEVDKEEGGVGVFELVIKRGGVGNLIGEGKREELGDVIERGEEVGMIRFEESYEEGVGEGGL